MIARKQQVYGTQRYKSGPMPTYTMKGFTGQYADSVTGLDYYNARYYDPVAGVFLSADSVQGNMQGMNPYGYVGGNPETMSDPTGKYYAPPGGPGGPTPPPPCNQSNNFCNTGNSRNQGLSCGQGTHQVGNTCLGNITCGAGTILEGSTCVSVENSKDGEYRTKSLESLRQQAILEELGGYFLGALGDILLMLNNAESLNARLEGFLDLVATIATTILPLIGEFFGEVPLWLSRVTTVLMGAGSVAQGILAGWNTRNWWLNTGEDVIALAALDGASGPAALVQAGLSTLLAPILGNFLDMGGHALLAKGFADYALYTSQANMPIQGWCAQYGGCPPES